MYVNQSTFVRMIQQLGLYSSFTGELLLYRCTGAAAVYIHTPLYRRFTAVTYSEKDGTKPLAAIDVQ